MTFMNIVRKKAWVFVGMLAGLICLHSVVWAACTKDREHVAEKLIEMYAERDSIEIELNKAFQAILEINGVGADVSEIQEANAKVNKAKRRMALFNEKCLAMVQDDPVLKAYFQSFCKTVSTEDTVIRVDSLNYYSPVVVKRLDQDLQDCWTQKRKFVGGVVNKL